MSCINEKSNVTEQASLWNQNKQKMINDESSKNAGLQYTSGPWASEGFVGGVSQVPIDRALEGRSDVPFPPPPTEINMKLPAALQHNSNVVKLEQDFNKVLAQYTTQYQLMAKEIMANNNQSVLQKYANHNVKHNNNFYHVNEFGFAQGYDNDAWGNRSVSCSQDPVEITSDEFSKLLGGPNMGKGQACNVAGFNVENADNGEASWVDIKGVRHVYPKDVWDKRNPSCTMTPRALSADEYNAITKGTDMTETTFCERLNVDPKILQNLANLNKQLLNLGTQLLTETHKLSSSDATLNTGIKTLQKSISSKLKQLQHVDQSFNNNIKLGNAGSGVMIGGDALNRSIEASTRDSELILRMNYLKYIVGLILVIFLVIFIFTTFSSDRQSVVSVIILLLVVVAVLYNFSNYIYLKFL
jgi:hypothetical protein